MTPDELTQLQELQLPDAPTPRANPRVQPPDADYSLRHGSGGLAESLGATVDHLRQLYTDMGLRPYRLWSVVVAWSGGEPGRGELTVVRETELLPTPRIEMPSYRQEGTAAGAKDDGSITITQLSPRYTEDDITAIFPTELPPGHQSFLEMRIDQRDGCTKRRRLAVVGVPWRRSEHFDWRVKVRDQEESRNRDGSFSRARLYPERMR